MRLCLKIPHQNTRLSVLLCWIASGVILAFLTGCSGSSTPVLTPDPSPTVTTTLHIIPSQQPSPTQTLQPTVTRTAGPSSTSTVRPSLSPQTWQAEPIMVEMSRIGNDPSNPNLHTPFFVLYGDGLLVIRTCEEGDCRFLQTQLDEFTLSRLINAIELTGFLNVNPTAFTVPGSTGAVVRISVQVYAENTAQIPDLDLWATIPDWYGQLIGCTGCYTPPDIDPAFFEIYHLLSTYQGEDWHGLETNRLALWITEPVIAGTPHPWDPELIPLDELAARSNCNGSRTQKQAVILEGAPARAVSSFLGQNAAIPLYAADGRVWQVQSRWLLPYEMPQTCDSPAGFYPPSAYPEITWHIEPETGAIPTPTPTITQTPTITPTPLR